MALRISRFRIDMGANPIKNLGQGTSTTDAARRDETVLMTGNQTVAGVKTFSSSPVFPSGTINAGDNLLLNPEFQVGATANLPLYWNIWQTPTLALVADTLFPALGGNQITITGSGATMEAIFIQGGAANWLKVKPSTIYTASFDYKCTAGDVLAFLIQSYNGATGGTAHFNQVELTSTTAIRYSGTFTTDANVTNLHFCFSAKNDGDIVIVSHPKLEEGSIATPFEPSYARTRLASKLISSSRDMASAAGDVSYTGVGFMPTAIQLTAAVNQTDTWLIGQVDSAKNAFSICQFPYGGALINVTTDFIRYFLNAGAFVIGNIKSFDSDGFTITWTKVLSPTGVISLGFLCFR